MSKGKHTPGPWKTGLMDELKSGSRCAWVSGDTGCIAHVYPDREHDGVDNVEATAALIAAAPELLEALREVRNCLLAGEQIPGSWLTRSKSTIAKAEGRS